MREYGSHKKEGWLPLPLPTHGYTFCARIGMCVGEGEKESDVQRHTIFALLDDAISFVASMPFHVSRSLLIPFVTACGDLLQTLRERVSELHFEQLPSPPLFPSPLPSPLSLSLSLSPFFSGTSFDTNKVLNFVNTQPAAYDFGRLGCLNFSFCMILNFVCASRSHGISNAMKARSLRTHANACEYMLTSE